MLQVLLLSPSGRTLLGIDTLSLERRIAWQAGPTTVIDQAGRPQVDVTSYGADGQDSADDTEAFVQALAALPETGGVLTIPAGTFRFNKSLEIDRPILLKGAGADVTRLKCNLGGRDNHCLQFYRYDCGDWLKLPDGASQGSQQLRISDSTEFTAGSYIELTMGNDAKTMYTSSAWDVSWAEDAVGQMVRVEAVDDGVLSLARPLYLDYPVKRNPRIRRVGMIDGAGIEDLRIERLDSGDGHTILMKFTVNSTIKDIESSNTMRSHVSVVQSLACEVSGSYFHHSHDYSDGGHGYGVDLGRHTTDCLVEDNVFAHLRHSMMAHIGSSGNVYAYNYSTASEVELCDISLHGHYSNNNLFESNVVEEIDIGDYWGPSGPGNTFLRNRVESEGFQVSDASHGENLLGNRVDGGGLEIESGVQDILLHGNRLGDEVQWNEGLTQTLPASLYLPARPAFLAGRPWPLLGPDVTEEGMLPAEERYRSGSPVRIE